jgi:hypothetical protein
MAYNTEAPLDFVSSASARPIRRASSSLKDAARLTAAGKQAALAPFPDISAPLAPLGPSETC